MTSEEFQCLVELSITRSNKKFLWVSQMFQKIESIICDLQGMKRIDEYKLHCKA